MNQLTHQSFPHESPERDNPVWRLRLFMDQEPTEIEVCEHPDRGGLVFVEDGWHPVRHEIIVSADGQ